MKIVIYSLILVVSIIQHLLSQPKDLQDLLDENLVPYLNNIFDPKIPLKGYESKEDNFKNTAVFLSHVHLDHSKIINYLNPISTFIYIRRNKVIIKYIKYK